LDVLLNTAGVPQKEVDKIKYLIESYQKVLGLDIIDVQNVEDFGLDYNLILLDLLNQVVEDTLGVHIDELSEDNIDKARDMVKTMISNEYHDIWDSAVKENWSLKDIKFLNYGEVLLTKVMEQKLFEINEGHTDLFRPIFDNNSERSIETVHSVVDTEVAKAILDIARTARCNRESIKIFGDINELLNRDHSAQVQMFKQINATMKSCVSRNYRLDESQKTAFRRLGLLECHEFLFNTLVENGSLEHDGSVFKDCLTEVWHSCFTKK
jgi:translation initiation factor 2 beta subunit (eIF-2beta)/eIF-5